MVVGTALLLCYQRISYTQTSGADGASIALQAQDMLHGNLLLHGWSVSDVSFYTTELPEYMLVELIHGLGLSDVHVAAAVTYTLLVLLAGLVAKGHATGRAGLLRILVASGIMIAPQAGLGSYILLLQPDHTGTGVPLLAIWLFLDRAPRRKHVVALVGLALTWATIGDRLVELAGALPIALMCAIRVCGAIRRKVPIGDCGYEISLGAAAIVSVPVAAIAGKAISMAGGYHAAPIRLGFASPLAWWSHLKLTTEGILALYGADFYRLGPGLLLLAALLHVFGLGLAAWGLRNGIRAWGPPCY